MLPEVARGLWDYHGEVKDKSRALDTWILKSEPGHNGYGHYNSNYTLTVTKASKAAVIMFLLGNGIGCCASGMRGMSASHGKCAAAHYRTQQFQHIYIEVSAWC